jgi:hypothetical protein
MTKHARKSFNFGQLFRTLESINAIRLGLQLYLFVKRDVLFILSIIYYLEEFDNYLLHFYLGSELEKSANLCASEIIIRLYSPYIFDYTNHL